MIVPRPKHRQLDSNYERRRVLLSGAASFTGLAAAACAGPLTMLCPPSALAAEAKASSAGGPFVFEDTSDKFTISVPEGWASGQGEISGAIAGPTGVDVGP